MSADSPFRTKEGLHSYVKSHSAQFENMWSLIFWHRPLPMAFVVVMVNALLLYISSCELPFYNVLILLETLYVGLSAIIPRYRDTVEKTLFRDKIKAMDRSCPNRIRNDEETVEFFWLLLSYFNSLKSKISSPNKNYAKETVKYLVIFIVCAVIGTNAILFIVVNSVLILPGVLFSSSCYKFAEPFVDSIYNHLAQK